MVEQDREIDALIENARLGDDAARQKLLSRYRALLRRMIAVRMDPRLLRRLDPSDVVQEILIDANRRLPEYINSRPLPFYAWLRQIAWTRLVDLHRRHVLAKRRSVRREEVLPLVLPEESILELGERLLADATDPIDRLIKGERREEVKIALAALSERDREVLVLRHLEQMQTNEIAAVLNISEGAVKARLLRALLRLRVKLEGISR